MPTYEYKNIETGEIYEFKQSMRDDALTHHPETGAAIKRIVSVPGIAFKGSGFYANDSRASTPKAVASKSGPPEAGTAGSTESASPASGGSEKRAPGGDSAPAKTPDQTRPDQTRPDKPAPSKSGG
ncbi:FmdB family zinc ribbon protein [Deinococcus sp.]|uniref:FmdB family zinc ribbon protein n=1 Tax=Deinococcus sp. TaxID=47478 RepID=UPI003C7B32A6